ncbi:MAG: class I SAM-dependent methyltransferase [Anaerolineae bacterium]
MDDISDIRALYDASLEREDERLVRHQLEFDLTLRYLETYLPPIGHVLELGAASGRYTLELVRRGYQVTAFDLSTELTGLARARVTAAGLADRVRWLVGDARDLAPLRDQVFDAALVMGPLYHLVLEADRRQVLRQAYGLLRAGAPLFTAFISRLGILGDLMAKTPDWIEKRDEVRWVMERGYDPPSSPRGGFRGYFARVEELAPLHEAEGFRTVVVAGVEPAISANDASYNGLEGARRAAWLDLLYRVSAEPSTVGASRHLLYVGQK